MFQRILVPLDGSERAERALPVAARIAKATHGSVILLRVVEVPIGYWPSYVLEPVLVESVMDTAIAAARDYLANVGVIPELEGVTTESMVLMGPAASTILAFAHSSHADLIVLCSHGYTGMTRWVLGSVAEKIARHALAPVFVLPEGRPLPVDIHPDAGQPLRVLVPLDGSAFAKAAIAPAAHVIAALAAPAKGAIHLTRVIKPMPSGSEQEDSEGKKHWLHKAKKYLSATVEHIQQELVAPDVANLKLTVTWSVAVDTDVAGALIRVAENGEDAEGAGVFGGCDLIAMATHGYGGFQRWAVGSITERVLGASRLPLLIVRPPDMVDTNSLKWDEETIASVQG
jgi:nucleotide-binding universal stress UspA family protein